MPNKIKTRFAPSPTGYLHIGGLRTALYNYIFALQNKGKFIVRIEDTDQARYVKDSEKKLIQTLQKMGLKWSEGPTLDKSLNLQENGQNNPYFQAKRLKIYQEYIEKLLNNKNAYYCFCSEGRLAELRQKQEAIKQPTKYDGLCRKLTESEINSRLKTQDSYTIRLKVPESREVVFKDIIRGEVKFNTSEIDDQVLVKSDGFPTYHLANVIDDHLMGITHVIRGEEWLSSTPKHILLYEAFGWQPPVFAHLPLLLNPDKSKLSKRQGDVAVEDFLDKGYLPEAIINYVALLGWHPKNDKEIFSLKELIKEFDLSRVQKAGAIFDVEKLKWFNARYLQKKSNKELLKLVHPYLSNVDEVILKNVLISQKSRLIVLSDIKELISSFTELADYQSNLLIYKKSDKEKTVEGLRIALAVIENLKKWGKGIIKEKMEDTVKKNNLTNGDLFWPTRVALSGQEKSAPPEEIMEIIGKNETLARIQKALTKLND